MTKQELRRYLDIKRECEQVEALIEKMNVRRSGLGELVMSGMPHGKGVSDLGKLLESLEGLQNRYVKLLAKLCAEQEKIENAISILPERERRLMRYRYIFGLEWLEICEKMHYEEAQIYRIHGIALLKLNDSK